MARRMGSHATPGRVGNWWRHPRSWFHLHLLNKCPGETSSPHHLKSGYMPREARVTNSSMTMNGGDGESRKTVTEPKYRLTKQSSCQTIIPLIVFGRAKLFTDAKKVWLIWSRCVLCPRVPSPETLCTELISPVARRLMSGHLKETYINIVNVAHVSIWYKLSTYLKIQPHLMSVHEEYVT